MLETRGSDVVIEKIVKLGQRISVAEMEKLSDISTAAGGSLVAVDPDDDRCGTGHLRFPWPPKPNEFHKVLNHLVESRIGFEVLINGIPVPDEILMRVSRQINRSM